MPPLACFPSLRLALLAPLRGCRVLVDEDTKIPNAATLTINKEDHTLANMLRSCVATLSLESSQGRPWTDPLRLPSLCLVPTARSLRRPRLPPSRIGPGVPPVPPSSAPPSQLLLLPYITFAGYKLPHPLESKVVLKLQTDGSQTPIQAVQEAIGALMILLGKCKTAFANELMKVRALEGTEEGFGAGEGFF